jgi:hypothetical protein
MDQPIHQDHRSSPRLPCSSRRPQGPARCGPPLTSTGSSRQASEEGSEGVPDAMGHLPSTAVDLSKSHGCSGLDGCARESAAVISIVVAPSRSLAFALAS